nr:magnesium/cobalt transporter CorA [Allomuricauda sp.]
MKIRKKSDYYTKTLKRRTSSKATIGQAPGTPVYVGQKLDKELYAEVFDYNEELFTEEQLNDIEKVYPYIDSKPITWVNINGLQHTSEIQKIGSYCGLHPLVIEDIVNTNQRPKLEEYGEYLFVVLKMLYLDSENSLVIEHVSLILGKGFVISFQEAEGDVFDPVRNRLRANKGILRTMGADYLLYVLMDAIVDHYFHLIDEIGNKVEHFEDKLFDKDSDESFTLEVQALKREVLRIRRAVMPLREVVNKMEKSTHSVISEKIIIYLRDLQDHVVQVNESIEIYREMTWSLMEMYMTAISNKMNSVMKVLTIIATIFIPLTFIAGIYGMNFENMPELRFRYSYFVLLGVMVVIFALMVLYFKKKKWL